eukprot:m.240448 g.240448  ORF g.240448 m.240448 type:complete len:604 (+) comp26282_c0_seq4:400-2211(+)
MSAMSEIIFVSGATGVALDSTLVPIIATLLGKGKGTSSRFRKRSASKGDKTRRVWTSKELCKQIVKQGHAATALEAQDICRSLITAGALIERDRRHCPASEFSHSNSSYKWYIKVREINTGDSASLTGSIGGGSTFSLGSRSENTSPLDERPSLSSSPSTAVESISPEGPQAYPTVHIDSSGSLQRGDSPKPRRRTLGTSDTNLEEGIAGASGTLVGRLPSNSHEPEPDCTAFTEDGSSYGGSPSRPVRPRGRIDSSASHGSYVTAEGSVDLGDEDDDDLSALPKPRKRRGHTSQTRFGSICVSSEADTLLCSDGAGSLLKERGRSSLEAEFAVLNDCAVQILEAREQSQPSRTPSRADKASEVLMGIMLDARDSLDVIAQTMQELYANEFFDSEMRKQLESAGAAQSRLERATPYIDALLKDKQLTCQGDGGDRETVRETWNSRFVNQIQQVEADHKDLKDTVWSVLRDGRDNIQALQDHHLFIDTMADESRRVQEEIDENLNWVLPIIDKFKKMGMRLLDRSATANFFRGRALYMRMLRCLQKHCGEEFVRKYMNFTYIPVFIGVLLLLRILMYGLWIIGVTRTFSLMAAYVGYEYFIALG